MGFDFVFRCTFIQNKLFGEHSLLLIELEFLDFEVFCLYLIMTTNKRTASSSMDDDIEAKKVKTDIDSTSSNVTTSEESRPVFLDENVTNKKICEYGESCYRQKNPKHTAEYDHPCKLSSLLKITTMSIVLRRKGSEFYNYYLSS